ncbi:MAG: SufD family Fe-S cluster assembly protein [Lachnospiraceae bacterium]|nr:SufD family Fe-S cluster assembly protein [Lachnospiraceae bacterium]
MNININHMPVYTFGWLKMNYAEVKDFNTLGKSNKKIIPCDNLVSETDMDLSDIESGAGKEIELLKKESGSTPVSYRLSEGCTPKDVFKVEINPVKEGSFDEFDFVVEKGACLTVLMDIKDGDDLGAAGILTRINLLDEAKVNLIQVIRPGKNARIINDIGVSLGERACLNLSQLFLEGKESYQGFKSKLSGKKSEINVNIGYRVNSGELLDMNYIADQYGTKTVSEFNVLGVLKDEARKNFRGTIDFKRGCSKSEGAENESVLLIGEGMVNKTTPLILCTEEDVSGTHGASIGCLDENVMFYMKSRGLSEEGIYELLSRAKIRAIINTIPDEETRKRLEEEYPVI